MAATLGADNPFRYRGYYYDAETGLYYLNSRYYNPEWGRFISADNYGGATGELLSHNMFAYCANNPVMASDPSGNLPSVHIMMTDSGKGIIGSHPDSNCYGTATNEGRIVRPGDLDDNPDTNYLTWAEYSDKHKDATLDDYRYFLGYLVVCDGGRAIGMGNAGLKAPIGANEYRLAMRINMRTGTKGAGAWHFMRSYTTDIWIQQKGAYDEIVFFDGETPESDWNLSSNKGLNVNIPNYYNSPTIYFAIPYK